MSFALLKLVNIFVYRKPTEYVLGADLGSSPGSSLGDPGGLPETHWDHFLFLHLSGSLQLQHSPVLRNSLLHSPEF